MFRCNHHHQGAHYLSLLKLRLLKQSIKIHRFGKSAYAATPPDLPQQCILIDCFNNLTSASSNSALPDDGDYTETCWSCFNVNFKTPFKAVLLCISR